MRTLGIAGWSGSGKTTLVLKLIPALRSRGLRVSTIKHAHHRFDVDTPGKDSYEHRRAGAEEVLVASARRWALMRELREEHEPPLEELVARLAPVDLVLVEGYKRFPQPKLVVHRFGAERPGRESDTGGPPLWRGDPHVIAVATDRPEAIGAAADAPAPLHLDDTDGIADFICGSLEIGSSEHGDRASV